MLGWCVQEGCSIGKDFRMILFPFLCQWLSIHNKKLEWGVHIRAPKVFL